MAELWLISDAPTSIDITVPQRYLDWKVPIKITFQPTSSTFQNECSTYNFNWVLVWSMCAVITDFYTANHGCEIYNYFDLMNKNSMQVFRTWEEGVRAGVQTIGAYMKLPAVMSLKKESVVWPGTIEVMGAYQKHPFQTLSDFNLVYGKTFESSVKAIYEEMIRFSLEPLLPNPPVLGPNPTPHIPVPESPVASPQPVIPSPGGVVPTTPSTWKMQLAQIIGAISFVFFFAQFFLPTGVVDIIKVLIELAKKYLGN